MKDKDIYVANVKFPDELCDEVINQLHHRDKTKPSTIQNGGNGFNPLERKDEIIFIDDYDYDLTTDMGVSHLVTAVNEHLTIAVQEYMEIWDSLKSSSIRSIRCKLQRTKPTGGYHIWHYEQGDLESSTRILVWTIYLNTIKDGGETEFLYQSKRIKANKGDIVIFPANYLYTHRGNPPLSKDKYILTGWYNLY